MIAYKALHGQSIREIATTLSVTDEQEIDRFITVCAFLFENPDSLSWRGNVKPSVTTKEGLERLATKFFKELHERSWPSEPTTVPDEAVSIVMREVYGYSEEQTETIKKEHQHSMSAENIVGALLERYIASVLEQHGWVWCAGSFVRAIDFIKFDAVNEKWQPVQVKNRDNSENSSSSAIRDGTTIEKWFRTYSKTGADNWAKFPEPEFRESLSEAGFRSFVRDYLRLGRV